MRLPTKILKAVAIILVVIILLIGLGMIVFPLFDGFFAKQEIKNNVQVFKELVEVTVPVPPDEMTSNIAATEPAERFPELRHALENYNRNLYESNQEGLTDPFAYETAIFDLAKYGLEQDIFGILSIPSIQVEMPLYLGCTNEHLSQGLSQLSYTSIPIGGKNTNAVIAGHRGYRGAKHLKDIESVSIGDLVYVQNPWETLVYRASEVLVIEPYEIDKLLIRDGEDMLTVFTCHPYQTGTHRYVLFCQRVEEDMAPAPTIEETEPQQQWEHIWQWQESVVITSDGETHESSQGKIILTQLFPWICLIIILFTAVMFLFFALRRKRRKKTA